MSNLSIVSPPVQYPKTETAVAFTSENGPPFRKAIIGITYPYADYFIKRSVTEVINVFEYVIEGEGDLLIDGQWQHAGAGDIYILRQNEPHEYRSDPQNPWKKIWINYVADYMPAFLSAYGIKSGIYHVESAHTYFEKAFSYTKSGVSHRHINQDIADCVHQIIRAVAAENPAEDSEEHSIREVLNAAVYDTINIDDLAAKFHMSKSNVIRVFKKRYGVTPYEYLLSLKISTAKILLRDTKMTVKEIAAKLHISDEHYFSSLFLAKVGMRPRDYRNKDRL